MSTDPGVLEARYRRLLRLYPPTYRHAQSEEMLDTLMQVSRPGQQRPDLREAVSLALGALRARTGAGRDRCAAQSWRGVHRLAVLFLLAAAAADPALHTGLLVQSLVASRGGLVSPVELGPPVALAVILAALLTTATGRKAWGLALCLAGAVAVEWSWHWPNVWSAVLQGAPNLVLLSVAAVLLAALPRGQVYRAARPWTWLLAVPAMFLTLPSTSGFLMLMVSQGPWFWYGSLLLFLLWTVVDPRVPVAVSAATVLVPLTIVVNLATGNVMGIGPVAPFLAYLLAPLVPLAAGVLRIARTARL